MAVNASVPVLEIPAILENTPVLIERVVKGYSQQTLQWRPNPERWSVAMVLAHLAEAEVTCFRTRLSRTVTEDCPVLEPYDQWLHLRARTEFDVDVSLSTFACERAQTLTFLRTVPRDALTRRCQHQKFGLMTFENLVNEFAFHDMGHLRQILELFRAQAHYPKMGGWRKYYSVNP
jgi:DinB superfamily